MTAPQFNNALERAGLSQAAFARILGITPRHVNRWARGANPAPMAAQIVLRLLASGKISTHDL